MIYFPLSIPIYSGWTTYAPVIPKFYYDVYSQEQLLKELALNFDRIEHYLDYIADLLNHWNIDFTTELQNEIENMWLAVNTGYKKALDNWFSDELPSIIKNAAKMVFFGLTQNGYFCAYIPDGWEDINFDTGYNYNDQSTYGRLILTYKVNDTFQYNGFPNLDD